MVFNAIIWLTALGFVSKNEKKMRDDISKLTYLQRPGQGPPLVALLEVLVLPFDCPFQHQIDMEESHD